MAATRLAPFLHEVPRRLHASATGAARRARMLADMLRRPSPSVSHPGAGLLAADPLRRPGAARTGATPGAFVSRPLCDPDLTRAPPRRSKTMRRIALFLLFVALLVVLPAVLARVMP